MHSLQPHQLESDSLLNMVLYPLLDMRGGASLCKPLEIPGEFWGSAGHRCLRSGHNRPELGGISPCHISMLTMDSFLRKRLGLGFQGFRVQGLGSGALGRGPNRLERNYDM